MFNYIFVIGNDKIKFVKIVKLKYNWNVDVNNKNIGKLRNN